MSFTNKILKTYFWQFAGNTLRFLSMFIVAPFLTKNPAEYGVYMVCMSTLVLFTFADFGFWNATLKFASEFVGKGNREMECRVISFSMFINMLFISVIMGVFVVLIFYPQFIIKDLQGEETYRVARRLLGILVISAPFKMIERSCKVLLNARVSVYLMRRIYMVSSLITIGAVFFFFSHKAYNVVGYFAFSVSIDIFALAVTIFEINRKFRINYLSILSKIGFDREVFHMMKNLAFSNFYSNLAWMLFANFDLIFLGSTLGAFAVATYGVAKNVLSYFETFIGSSGICGPYLARFNHIVSTGNDQDLKSYYFKVAGILLPAVIIPIVTMVGMIDPFIQCWVGTKYAESGGIASILLFSMILHFISMPAGYVLTAKNRAFILAVATTIILVVYWSIVWLLMPVIGINAMPIGKTCAYIITGIFQIIVVAGILKIGIKDIFVRFILPGVIVLVVSYLLTNKVSVHLPTEKSKIHLLQIIITYMSLTGTMFVGYFLIVPSTRKELFAVVSSISKKLGFLKKRGDT